MIKFQTTKIVHAKVIALLYKFILRQIITLHKLLEFLQKIKLIYF